MLRAARTAVLLSVLFVVVYGGTNWLTAQRPAADIGTWYSEWELSAVPYVPLRILPYMSIDLFFFAAPFLCDDRERRVLARRVVFSILVAAAFFLLFPLRLAWPSRPAVGGWFGEFVEQSCTAPFLMEYPHNLFPTLHVALCLILMDVYAGHTRGLVRWLAMAWFVLIGLSTVLTWQHHVVDVAGGLLLGAFAIHLFRETDVRSSVVPNLRIGAYYAAGSVAVTALMPAIWPWGVFLLWPAAALALVAAGYFGLGPSVYRKTADGRLPLSTRVVLAPVLLGQYLSLNYYRRQCRPWDEVAPGVLVGRVLSNAEAAAAVRHGVTAVVDLTAEFAEASPFRAVTYRNLPVLDLTAPTPGQLAEAVAFIAAHADAGMVYVHCKIGYSRAAAVVGAYLLATGQSATASEAVARLRWARPSIVVRPEAVAVLESLNADLVATGRNPSFYLTLPRSSSHLGPNPVMTIR
jgi:protein-tyrosine phosphatase/membrane-associated phospholipid phosphatase